MIERLPLVDHAPWIDAWDRAFERHRDQGLGEAVSAAADVALRRLAFHLSSRYWEGRFLEGLVAQQGLPGWTREVQAFRTLGMILPCVVSTFDRLPSLLKRSERGHGRVPMWAEADVLIVDEAGQAGPDKGALAFAYADRALVVGDVRQLAPVSDEDSPFFDQEIGEEHDVADHEARMRGLLCGEAIVSVNRASVFLDEVVGRESAYGSIMRAASASSSFSSGSNDAGMWLYDHFRCEPTIIDYCNRLWYGGRLVARTVRREREPGVPHLPPMAHLNVVGRNVFSGGSRANPDEAERIVDWLVEQRDYLVRTFGKPGQDLDDIVAIVTPFAAQNRLIRDLISQRLRPVIGSRARKIVHGTVHTLQGAERPVVIFSTVYSGEMFERQATASYFFDREPRLLNVAVSRAQQAFVVIGDRRVFDRAPKESASAHLRGHLAFHENLPFIETTVEQAERERVRLSSVIDPLQSAPDWR